MQHVQESHCIFPSTVASLCYLLSASLLFGGEPLRCEEAKRQYLSGNNKDDAVLWEFKCSSGAKSGVWSQLPVPAHWDLHGFGSLNYRQDPPEVHDEIGHYRHTFDGPDDWTGKRVFLVFEGVMTDTTVKLNGQGVGPVHQGGFYQFRYEVTPHLKFNSRNTLEVDVAKHSANESVNNAERKGDYWVFGGIYRPVYLEAVPESFIQRVAIDARADGDFAMDVFVDRALNALEVSAQIRKLDGTPIGKEFSTSLQRGQATLSSRIDGPLAWSAETPHLYRVDVALRDGKRTIHHRSQRFGFRSVEVREGDGIYVNGQRVVLKGVNRHSSWPDSGRCLSREVHRLDIETIKAMNMNAVRMSHYPPDQEFLDLCDELGLYVLDELAGWHWHYDTEVGKKLVEEMVTRDVNHACILFWNNGNEGGFNRELDDVFAQFDPQHRRVLHPWEEFSGINTAHYLEYPRAQVASQGAATRHGTGEKYEEWEDLDDPNKYIYMPTEMLHGLYDGGGGAGFEDYWRMMQQSPYLGGGFFWVLADEAIRRPDTGQLDAAGNQAPDGMVGPYREREASFYAIKELWSPIVLERSEAGGFVVHNHYSFTNADQCTLTWELREFADPTTDAPSVNIRRSGSARLPDIPPGESGALHLDIDELSNHVGALALRIDDPQGRELWTWTWPLGQIGVSNGQMTASRNRNPAPVVSESSDALEVRCGNVKLEFGSRSGLLARVTCSGQVIPLANGPRIQGDSTILRRLSHETDGSDVIVDATYDGKLNRATWRIRSNGWITCQYRYREDGEVPYHGVIFDFPQDAVISKRWLGDGPFRVWKNRRRGVRLGVWENDYNETATGYSGWQYPEFKGCFANVHWLKLLARQGSVLIVPGSQDGFVQVLTPEFPPEELIANTKVALPEAGIGVLHAIPPMGSKFKHHSTTGPQGQPNVASGTYTGIVSFFFKDKVERISVPKAGQR